MLSAVIMMLVWACQHQEHRELASTLVAAQLSALAFAGDQYMEEEWLQAKHTPKLSDCRSASC